MRVRTVTSRLPGGHQTRDRWRRLLVRLPNQLGGERTPLHPRSSWRELAPVSAVAAFRPVVDVRTTVSCCGVELVHHAVVLGS